MFKNNSSFNVLYTEDIETTYSFFNKIGCIISQKDEDKVVVNFGSFDLHFILSSTEPSEDYQYIALDKNRGSGNIFYIECDNIEQDFQNVKMAGGIIKTSIFNNHWNCLEFLFEDFNGYKFCLYQEN